MSLTQAQIPNKHDESAGWVTKADFHYDYRVSYALISRAVDRGQISIKLDVDGKIKINLAEAKAAFGKADLFA
jgi:hypothetical protein